MSLLCCSLFEGTSNTTMAGDWANADNDNNGKLARRLKSGHHLAPKPALLARRFLRCSLSPRMRQLIETRALSRMGSCTTPSLHVRALRVGLAALSVLALGAVMSLSWSILQRAVVRYFRCGYEVNCLNSPHQSDRCNSVNESDNPFPSRSVGTGRTARRHSVVRA